MQVPLLDLRAQYAPLKAQFLAAIEEVCDSQSLVLGPKTESFEAAVAEGRLVFLPVDSDAALN